MKQVEEKQSQFKSLSEELAEKSSELLKLEEETTKNATRLESFNFEKQKIIQSL